MNEPNIEAAIAYALQRLAAELPPELTYHSLAHTRDEVLPAATRLGQLAGLRARDANLLRVGAAFHDLGFTERTDDHEICSARIAAQVLPAFEFSARAIEEVMALVMATRMPQSPRTLLERLLCDADLSGLATETFFRRSEDLLQELRALGEMISAEEWWREQVKFLKGHHYWTEYAEDVGAAGKAQNLRRVRAHLSEASGPPEKQ